MPPLMRLPAYPGTEQNLHLLLETIAGPWLPVVLLNNFMIHAFCTTKISGNVKWLLCESTSRGNE